MKRINKYLILGIVLVLLVIDWAALDDITTGSEPNYNGEWDILLFSLIIFGLLLYSHKKGLQKWITKKSSKS